MRLGQLARKLVLRPSQIVDYLATQQVFPDEGSNARLSDEVTERVILHFAPERLNEMMTIEEKISDPVTPSVAIEEQPSNTNIVEEVMSIEVAPSPINETLLEKPEVIKAPKVELTGLKVLGKIELQETKKKSLPVSETTEGDANEELPIKQKPLRRTERNENSSLRRESNTSRSARNPIAMQREQKAREEEEKRKAKAVRDKEKRTQHYLKRVTTGQPTKAVKIVSEPTESYEMQEVKPAPKTWLGKFLRWLNT